MPATFGGKIKPWELGVKSCWIAAGKFEGFQDFPYKKKKTCKKCNEVCGLVS